VARAVALGGRLRPVVHPLRSGTHPFTDYARNGTVAAAFRFVLDRVAA
jgi:hypothetical protein